MSITEQFLTLFTVGDEPAAYALLAESPELREKLEESHAAHPLLRQFVERNDGHCYKPSHLNIANLLLSSEVKSFRTAVLGNDLAAVIKHLQADPQIAHAEFTAGRGIAQAIHHWQLPAIARVLLDTGADIEQLTTRGETPLTMQLRFGTVHGVRFLLEQGANPNHGAGGHMPSDTMNERMELLLAYGWDINRGELLHDASHGFGRRVQLWLQHGADPNATNEQGQTALHLVAARGIGRDVLRALIDAGANLNFRDKRGETPLDLARKADSQVAAKELTKLNAERGDPI